MNSLFAILVLAAAASAEITKTTPNVRLVGTFQDDVLIGGTGHDLLIGGRGDDRLIGGPGHDELRGDNGDDHYVGGPGQDLFYFSRSERGEKRLEDFTPNEDWIEVQFPVDLSRGLQVGGEWSYTLTFGLVLVSPVALEAGDFRPGGRDGVDVTEDDVTEDDVTEDPVVN